jgi:chromosome segregation ATPase
MAERDEIAREMDAAGEQMDSIRGSVSELTLDRDRLAEMLDTAKGELLAQRELISKGEVLHSRAAVAEMRGALDAAKREIAELSRELADSRRHATEANRALAETKGELEQVRALAAGLDESHGSAAREVRGSEKCFLFCVVFFFFFFLFFFFCRFVKI